MKIFITGSTGFVGSHLSKLLLKENHQLYLLARNPKRLPSELQTFAIQGDLSDNSIQTWCNQLPEDLECIIHVAGVVHCFNIEKFYKINSESTKCLINNLKIKYNKLHFVLISSLAAAGPPPTNNSPKVETDNSNPVSHYGKSKLKAEQYLLNLKNENWTYNIVRPPMVIGPDDPAFLDVFKMVKGGIVPLAGFGSMDYTYSFVCVYDLVNGIAKLATINLDKTKNQIFYLAHPEVVKMRDILENIALHLKPRFQFNISLPILLLKYLSFLFLMLDKLKITTQRITPDKIFELKVKNWTCDCSKSIENNFSYDWNLPKTIKVTYNNYHENNLI